MSKVYVVSSIGFEYDDQYYTVAGSNYGDSFGDPVQVFSTKEKAEENKRKRTVEHLRNHFVSSRYNELGAYAPEGEGFEGIFCDVDAALRFWKLEFDIELDEDDYWNVGIPDGTTDEQLDRIVDLLSLNFFSITEVDFDE